MHGLEKAKLQLASGVLSEGLEAIEWLSGRRSDAAVPLLVEALNAEDWEIQTAAVRALAATDEKSVVPVLFKVARDEEGRLWETRQAALHALCALDARAEIEERLRYDGDFVVRLEAARLLGELADARSDSALERASQNDSDARVREAAAAALTRSDRK